MRLGCLPVRSLENFGNASSVTIPTCIAFNLASSVRTQTQRVCLGGFGAGLSWGGILMNPAAVVVKIAELLKKMVSFEAVTWWGDAVPVTIAVGGTAAQPDDTVDSILGRSEKALRMSVTGGGGRVTIL